MAPCEVCKKLTEKCVPSPFCPCSYWRCEDCFKSKRVSYFDLLCAVYGRIHGDSLYDREFGTQYLDKYIKPTLDYFGKTYEEMVVDAESNMEQLNKKEYKYEG